MAAAQKLYPRSNVKRIIKAHSKRNLSRNADILVCTPQCPATKTMLVVFGLGGLPHIVPMLM